MIAPHQTIYLLSSSATTERVLHPGEVAEVSAGRVVARFDDSITPAVGSQAHLHFEHNRKFMQQSAKVHAVLAAQPTPLIAFNMVGKPVCVESRATFRITIPAGNVRITINDSDQCDVQDLCATGLGVSSSRRYKKGDILEITLHHESDAWYGQAIVQSVRPCPDGSTRYGLQVRAANVGRTRSALEAGLAQVMVQAQRRKTQRQATA